MSRPRKNAELGAAKPPKTIGSTQSLSAFVKSICDIMRRSNCASALQYVPELTWILFLRLLDAQEERARDEAEAVGQPFTPLCLRPGAGRTGPRRTAKNQPSAPAKARPSAGSGKS